MVVGLRLLVFGKACGDYEILICLKPLLTDSRQLTTDNH